MDDNSMIFISPWTRPLWWAGAVLLASQVICEILFRVTWRRSASPGPSLVGRRCEVALRCVASAIALQFAWQGVADTAPWVEDVRHANRVMIILSLTWLGIAGISGVTSAMLRGVRDPTAGDTLDSLQMHRLRVRTQWVQRTAIAAVSLTGAACALMTFPSARHIGASLLASAGVASLALGMAARPLFGNLIAGAQLALSQPFKVGDLLTVQGEIGVVEDFKATFVVLGLPNQHRLHVPVRWFVENPFASWSRESSYVVGVVLFWVDYAMQVEALRQEAVHACAASPHWDARLCRLQVYDATPQGVQVRIQVSASTPAHNVELCCQVREALVQMMQREHADALPRQRLMFGVQPDARTAPNDFRQAANEGLTLPPNVGVHSPGG